MNQIVGRLAPSPTGAQHIGNARTYLIAWLSARTRGGRVLLRIEDIDSPRVKSGAAEQALADLRWLGLDWDGVPLVQTTRLSAYEAALARLQSEELVYPCTCTRRDVERAASAPHDEEPAYPGTCARQRVSDAASLPGRPYAWRMRAGTAGFDWQDGCRGTLHFELRSPASDFVVWKAAGTPAYQLAVVIDDAAQGVTEVIRGDDLISSTPRQLLLYRALDLKPPAFTHVPLVVGPDGRRLAKRHGDTRLSTLREAGVLPQAVLGLIAWSCGWIEGIQPVSLTELLPLFRLASIPRKPFVLTPELLRKSGYMEA